MSVTYRTKVIASGNHASLAIPDEILTKLGSHRRAPLIVTINGHSYQSTATAVNGQCRVVFPMAERLAAGVSGGDLVTVKLDLDGGYRRVELHPKLMEALRITKLRKEFDNLSYSARKELARSISDAKSEATRERRIKKAIQQISSR